MGACVCGNDYARFDHPEFKKFPTLQHRYKEHIYCRAYPLPLIKANKNTWDTMRHFKIVFLGESKVGKTSIISQKVSFKFDSEYQPTIEDYYVKVHRINTEDINVSDASNSRKLSRSSFSEQQSISTRYDTNGINYNNLPCFHCILDIQDTSGSLDFRQNVSQWIWRSQVFVIVFDLTDRKTFENIENEFISRIIDLRKVQHPPVILVGNKADVLSTNSYFNYSSPKSTSTKPNIKDNSDNTEVNLDKIEEICNKYNIPYIECSAKERYNLNHVFDMCVKERLFHEAYWKKEEFMERRNSVYDK